MPDIDEILGRTGECTTPCSDQGTPITDGDECFAYNAANIEQPSCEDWENGFQDCEGKPTVNLIGKLNWLFNRIICAFKDVYVCLDDLKARVTVIEGWRRLVDISFNPATGIVTETYSDGSTETNNLSVFFDDTTIPDTDTDTRIDNVNISAPNANGDQVVSWQVINVVTGAVISTAQYTIQGSPPASASSQVLPVPVRILNIARNRADGTFDSGNVSVNLNALAGVTVPAGATAAIVRCASSVSGQDQAGLGVASLFAYGHIEVAGTVGNLNGGNFFSPHAVVTQATYVDTNLIQSDNDDTNEVIVPLNGTSIAYRAKCRFDNTLGLDVGFARISIVGFIV